MSTSAEYEALRDEIRYWRRKATKAVAKANEASLRASDIRTPRVTVERSPVDGGGDLVWWRVFVNGEYIDGHETEGLAECNARRLRKAFEMNK